MKTEIELDDGGCTHCWHSTGRCLMSNPPQYELLELRHK